MAYASRIMDVTANNLSNLNSEGFKASKVSGVDLAGGGVRAEVAPNPSPGRVGQDATTELSNVNLEEELVQLQVSPLLYRANLAVWIAGESRVGELLDKEI